jgi:hypothetical protein
MLRRAAARWIATAALTLAAALPAIAAAYPKPAAIPFRWQLDFDAGDLRLYSDPAGGSYWYFTYTITNTTGKERIWAPSLVLFTDAGEILASGTGVPSRVEESIRDLIGNELLERQSEIIGEVLVGAEHARDGLAVWPAATLDVNEIALFVGGLSGETARVTDPTTGQSHILRKTLHRSYLIRGDALSRRSKAIELVGETWILR